MITTVVQSPNFAKRKKKLKKGQTGKLDDTVRAIMENPSIGDQKVGDLQGIHVYKFKIGNNRILLAYEVVDTTLYLYSFGSHQNFYRDLSKYIHG